MPVITAGWGVGGTVCGAASNKGIPANHKNDTTVMSFGLIWSFLSGYEAPPSRLKQDSIMSIAFAIYLKKAAISVRPSRHGRTSTKPSL